MVNIAIYSYNSPVKTSCGGRVTGGLVIDIQCNYKYYLMESMLVSSPVGLWL